jgi:hypothetical protein
MSLPSLQIAPLLKPYCAVSPPILIPSLVEWTTSPPSSKVLIMDTTRDFQPTDPPSYSEHFTKSPNDRKRFWTGVPLRRNRPCADVTTVQQGVFVMSSNSRLVRSGFPYQKALASIYVPAQDWLNFTVEIAAAVQQTSRDRLRIFLTGIVTGGILFCIIGPPSLLVGVTSARSVDRAVERERLLQNASPGEALNRTLQKWNVAYFLPRHLHVRLEVPDDENKDEFPWQGAGHRSSTHPKTHKRGCAEGVLRVTLQQDVFMYWVEGLEKPRLVVSRILADGG